MGQKVQVIDSWHAHVVPGMFGSIELVYSDGYAVHFAETQGHLGKKQPATVFMPRGHVAAVAETDEGKPCLVNESGDGAVREKPAV